MRKVWEPNVTGSAFDEKPHCQLHITANSVNRRFQRKPGELNKLGVLRSNNGASPQERLVCVCVCVCFVLLHNIDIFPLTPNTAFPHRPRMSSLFPSDKSKTDTDPSRDRQHPHVLDFRFEERWQRFFSLVIYIVPRPFLFCPDQMVKRSRQDKDTFLNVCSWLKKNNKKNSKLNSDSSSKEQQITEICGNWIFLGGEWGYILGNAFIISQTSCSSAAWSLRGSLGGGWVGERGGEKCNFSC